MWDVKIYSFGDLSQDEYLQDEGRPKYILDEDVDFRCELLRDVIVRSLNEINYLKTYKNDIVGKSSWENIKPKKIEDFVTSVEDDDFLVACGITYKRGK